MPNDTNHRTLNVINFNFRFDKEHEQQQMPNQVLWEKVFNLVPSKFGPINSHQQRQHEKKNWRYFVYSNAERTVICVLGSRSP